MITDNIISKRPMPIDHKSNSVQAERASFAKVCKKSMYASICCGRAEPFPSSFSWLPVPDEQVNLWEADQFSRALEYRFVICCRSSDGNPITEVAEYWSMYLFTYKVSWMSKRISTYLHQLNKGCWGKLEMQLHTTCQQFTQRTSAYLLIHASRSFCDVQASVPIVWLTHVPVLKAYNSGFTRPMLCKKQETYLAASGWDKQSSKDEGTAAAACKEEKADKQRIRGSYNQAKTLTDS